jgi:flavin-dependent thymidylate synthase
VHAFERPFENVVATARTCYSSKGIVTEDQASAKPERRDALAKSIYAAGHHTTFQHAHFQFALENVSRQFLWTFLHSHPFYNSEQVSQRYVEVKGGNYAVPPMGPAERDLFEKTALAQQEAYERLTRLLTPLAGERYFGLFPGRTRGDGRKKFAGAVQKRAQEIARYVLPVATFAYLYHTVSGITLFRYWRLCESFDAPTEQREIVGQMVEEVLRHDPLYAAVLQDPLPLEETQEFALFQSLAESRPADGDFQREFDRELSGRVSRPVDWKANNEEIRVLGPRDPAFPRRAAPTTRRSGSPLDPGKPPPWRDPDADDAQARARSSTRPTRSARSLHTADSQDQRHRMTPAFPAGARVSPTSGLRRPNAQPDAGGRGP